MKYKFFRKVFLFVVLTIVSCCPSGTDIYTIVKRTYNKGNDTIDFGEALCFEWDRMYWFPAGYPLEYVNSIVNINRFYPDMGDRIVFVNDGKRNSDEVLKYKWQVDRDGNTLNKPIGLFDHAMDAIRYVAMARLPMRATGRARAHIITN